MHRLQIPCTARAVAAVTTIGMFGLASGTAWSQASAPADTTSVASTDSGALEEVVVTAQKREENVQKTPVAVSTVSNDELVRRGATQLGDLERAIPDVKLTRQGTSAMTVSIRGVFSTDTSPTSEAAIAMHVNGAYLPKTRGLDGFLFDLDRVEVAKGPQGTLYGRNANGGTINIITKKPVLDQNEGDGELEYGSYNLIRGMAAVNVGIGDTLAVRAAFQTLSHKGYLENGQDDADQKSGRVSLLWKPNDISTLTIVADSAQNGGYGSGINVVRANAPGYYVPPNPRDSRFYTVPVDPVTGLRSANTRPDQLLDDRNTGISIQYDQDVGFATWTTQASWRDFNSFLRSIVNYGQGPVAGPGGAPTAGRNWNPQHYREESFESRLVSTSTTPLEWVAGLYAFHDNDGGTMVGYTGPLTTTPSIEIANGNEDAYSYAAFGQLTYTPAALESLHFTGGARFTEDKKDVSGIFTRFGLGPASVVSPKSSSYNKFTYKAGVSYDLTDANLVYANYSTGYKAGGYAYGPGINPALGPIYAPETIKAYEIGSKNRFFDNRLQVNLEGWYYKYSDYQTNVTLFAPGSPLPILTATTAGAATYKGATITLQYALSRVDSLALDFSAMSARYNDFVIQAPTGGGLALVPGNPSAVINRSDTPITGVPHSTGNASYDHTFKLASGSLDALVAAEYRGSITHDLQFDPVYGEVRFDDSSFALWDFSLRYESEQANWSVTGYVHNIADSLEYRSGAYSTQTHLFTANFYDPRTFGVVFSVKVK